MNVSELQRKLIAAARADVQTDRVPYGFEQRVLAHIRAAAPEDTWAQWARGLWRAAAPCAAVALLLGVWALAEAPTDFSNQDLATEFERIVLADTEPATTTTPADLLQ